MYILVDFNFFFVLVRNMVDLLFDNYILVLIDEKVVGFDFDVIF